MLFLCRYRLAPEHPFPAGLDDCDTVTQHILNCGDSAPLSIDRSRVILAGDSAGKISYPNRCLSIRKIITLCYVLGGNFAAVLSMRFATNRQATYRPLAQVLIYPLLQFFDFMLPSYQEDHYEVYPYSIEYALSAYIGETIDKSIYRNNHTSVEQKRYYRRLVDWNLLPADSRETHARPTMDTYEGDAIVVQRASKALHSEISPLLVEDSELTRLPPTYVLTVGHDRLRDEGLIYVARLRTCGVQVVHHHYKDTFHASITLLYGMAKLDIAQQMVRDIVDFLVSTLKEWGYSHYFLLRTAHKCCSVFFP